MVVDNLTEIKLFLWRFFNHLKVWYTNNYVNGKRLNPW